VRMSRHRLTPWILAACAAFLALLALPRGGARASAAEDPAVVAAEGDAIPAHPGAQAPSLPAPELGPMRLDAARGRYVAPLGQGEALLTLEPVLQQKLTKVLSDYRVPWGATVLLDPRSGRVLAMAEHSQMEKGSPVALKAVAPAASVFKIVTAAALLEQGIGEESEVCYHGGKHRIARKQLADDPRRDRRCLTLQAAMGRSANVVFAKLADRGLTRDRLQSEAQRWLFNASIPFARPVEVSRAEIPEEPFDLATTAAGFGRVRLSPLHGALIAAVVANGGVLAPPRLVDAVAGGELPPVAGPTRVVDERVAAALARMMRTTTTDGTARKIFRRDRWSRRSPLREVAVAGKTGSLHEQKPFRDYSWFVGFAPVDDPQVVVATVVVNERLWRVKAPYVAHQALEVFFATAPARSLALAPAPPARAASR